MKTLCVPAFVILTVVSAVMPLSAHHSWPISYDRLVTVKGTVIDFRWANPHPMMTLEVQANDGRTEKWEIGGPAINRMESNGWTKATVKPGDQGTQVRALQRALAHLGYPPGKVDGIYGPLTKGAVGRFQTAAKVKVDGICGPVTLAALVRALHGH